MGAFGGGGGGVVVVVSGAGGGNGRIVIFGALNEREIQVLVEV